VRYDEDGTEDSEEWNAMSLFEDTIVAILPGLNHTEIFLPGHLL
jgi:hypothetical protein